MTNRQKHRATATLSWTFDSDSRDALNVARAYLEELIGDDEELKVALKVDRLREKKSKIILGEFLPSEVLPFVRNDEERRIYRVKDKEYEVRMNSHRYFIFRASQKCAACGIVGVKMVLEQHPNDKSPHFNLYAEENGKLILMTKDHIRAKSFGGEDRHSNYQTMCAICNNLKGNDNLTLDAIKTLRDIYNENQTRLSRKKLNSLINVERVKLKNPQQWERTSRSRQGRVSTASKAKENFVLLKSDIVVMDGPDGLIGMSVYESADKGKGMRQVACIKKGTLLTPQSSKDHHILVAFNDTTFKLYHGYTEYTENL